MPDAIPLTPSRELITAAERPAGVRVLARAPALNRDAELVDENRIIMILADDQPWDHFYYHRETGAFFEKVVLRMTPSAINLDRLKAGNCSLLKHHDRREELGRVSEAWINQGRFEVAADFSLREWPQSVKMDVQERILAGVSINARPLELRVLAMPTPENPEGLLEAVKWELLEATITPMPENNRARVISADVVAAIEADVSRETWAPIAASLAPDADDDAVSFVQPETLVAIRAALQAPRPSNPESTPVEETDKVTPEELQAEVDRLNAEIEANKADAAKSAELQASLDKIKSENLTAAVEAERREEIRDLALRHGVGHEKADEAITAGTKAIDFAKELAQLKADAEGRSTIPAVPKPTPNMANLNLDSLLAEMYEPSSERARENASESHRIIEVERARTPHRYAALPTCAGSARGEGLNIPDTLLMAETNQRLELQQRSQRHQSAVEATQNRLIQAAITTTTTAAGIIDPMVLQGDLVDTLIGINGLISMCRIYPNLSDPINIPKVTAAPRAGAVAEGAAASAAATLTIDDVEFRPKQLRVFWSVTPESYVTSRGRAPSIAVSEAARLMMDEAEEELWLGNNAGGRVQGFESKLAAARKSTYAAAITDADLKTAVRNLQAAMTKEKIPVMNRVWVATPDMCAWADLQYRVEGVAPLVEYEGMMSRMFRYPFMESTYPTEVAAHQGRMWHLSPDQVGVAFFGGDTELILDRENATGNYLGTLIKLWDVQYLRDEFAQELHEA